MPYGNTSHKHTLNDCQAKGFKNANLKAACVVTSIMGMGLQACVRGQFLVDLFQWHHLYHHTHTKLLSPNLS